MDGGMEIRRPQRLHRKCYYCCIEHMIIVIAADTRMTPPPLCVSVCACVRACVRACAVSTPRSARYAMWGESDCFTTPTIS
ncbi:hypothetical protein RR46_04414 [Papilio xuthus]|uniref:Uncharacterized protein n=1 Tax=Papilio xuthus TaxID=66420 RepID=A0A194PLN5_PAPXU|nr:hypothetical protein RR46_04414 [Papilio xuthus]